MRVLWLRPAGKAHTSHRRERVAERLRPRGFDVVLRDATVRNLGRSAREVRAGEYDVLVGTVRLGLYAGYPIARLGRVPFVADVADSLAALRRRLPRLYPVLSAYEYRVLRWADARVFVPEAYRYVEDDLGDRPAAVAPNGVDFETFADPDPAICERAASLLSAHGVDVDDRVAVYVGSFSGTQAIPPILDAAPLAPDWQFLLLGDGSETPAVERAAAAHANVAYPGTVPYELVPGVLAHADAAFCLTRTERPLKVSEYGAAGLPTLGRRGQLDREFDDDELLFVEPTPPAIADALGRLAADPELAAAHGEALRANAERHSWDDVADTYAEVFVAVGQDAGERPGDADGRPGVTGGGSVREPPEPVDPDRRRD